MEALEKEVEEAIFALATNANSTLADRGMALYKGTHRQVNLGGYGIADLISYEHIPETNTYNFKVVEIKKDGVGVGTLLQACRYARAIQLYFSDQHDNPKVNVEIVLVGRYIDGQTDFPLMLSIFKNLSVYTYSISILSGISFERVGHFEKTDAVIPEIAPSLKLYEFSMDTDDTEATSD